jgi:predicted aldo/keto reductase-like oxidoreductase
VQYRTFGRLDWKVSALGFGCMRLPSKGPVPFRADTEESVRLIRHAIDMGINYFDTAWPYHLGASERILGRALDGGYRKKVYLVTKSPIFIIRAAEDFDKHLHNQMAKLQTDYLDAYLFHSMSGGQFEKLKALKLMDRMLAAKDKGLVKSIGFSFHDTLPAFKEIVDYYPWDIVQIQYNYMDTGFQAGTGGLKYAYEKGIAVVAMEPLKGGRLANPPAEALRIMDSAGTRRSPVDWALQFLWNRPEISVVLSGMGTRKMVDENCASADRSGINTLSGEDGEIIARLVEVYRQRILVDCTACGYCLPCPAGVDIPQNFAILNNAALEDRRLRAWLERRKYRKVAASKQRLDRENPNGNAAMCSQCGQCLKKCPQGINVPEELKKVHAALSN